MTEYDYNGNVNDSIYYDFYQEQITELCVIAADMYNELDGIKSKLWYEMPEKHIEFCDEDTCTQTAIAWWNTAACMLSDIDMGTVSVQGTVNFGGKATDTAMVTISTDFNETIRADMDAKAASGVVQVDFIEIKTT